MAKVNVYISNEVHNKITAIVENDAKKGREIKISVFLVHLRCCWN